MSRNFDLRRFAVYPAALFLLLLTPFMLSCGGGDGEGGAGVDGGGNAAEPDSAEALFEKQNSAAINYFQDLGLLYDYIATSEKELLNIDPTDVSAQEAHIRKVADNILPIGDDLERQWNSMLQLEQDFQETATAKTANILSFSAGRIEPQVEPATVLVSACLASLTAYSWAETLNESSRTFSENLDYCGREHNKLVEKIIIDYPNEEQRNEAFRSAWVWYLDCTKWAEGVVNREDIGATLAAIGSSVAPALVPNWPFGKGLIQGSAAVADVANIYILGTNPTADPQSLSPYATNNVRDHFVARTLENGEFYAPVGEWNITAFKDGYIRFGTSDAQRIVVRENQTTSVVANPTLVSEGEAFRQTCQTGGVPDDNGATAGNFRLLFYVNFDGSVGTDLARADIKLSGSASFPYISWNRDDVVAIMVHEDRSDKWLYGLYASDDADTGELVPLASPLQYGDYSRPSTLRMSGYETVSPAMSPGAHYSITLGIEDASSYAQLVFSVE